MTHKISAYSPADPVAPVKVSNGNGAVADKSQGDAPAAGAAAAAAQTGDTVTLTTSARTLQKIEEKVAKTPVVNSAKVAAVKQAVNSGNYQIDAGRVADKLMQFERGLK